MGAAGSKARGGSGFRSRERRTLSAWNAPAPLAARQSAKAMQNGSTRAEARTTDPGPASVVFGVSLPSRRRHPSRVNASERSGERRTLRSLWVILRLQPPVVSETVQKISDFVRIGRLLHEGIGPKPIGMG